MILKINRNTLLAVILFAAVGLTACSKRPADLVRLDEFRANGPQFQSKLADWSKFVVEEPKKPITEKKIGAVTGKFIFLKREFNASNDPVPVAEFDLKNETLELQERALIATSPDAVTHLVFIHTIVDRYQLYEKYKSWTVNKYRVYLVDAKAGTVIGAEELKVDKAEPPKWVKDNISLKPDEKLDKIIAGFTAAGQ